MSNYKQITPRNIAQTDTSKVENCFHVKVDDAINLDPNRNIIVGITNIGKNVPILQILFEQISFINLSQSFSDNSLVLIDYQEKAYYIDNQKYGLNIDEQKSLEDVYQRFKDYGGYLNEQGEHIINLQSEKIGPHFAVNLLLGDRSHLSEPLLTTPKSVIDEFGGGSFRGPAATQVLATRWDMDPAENGNPFNRQFYLVENNRQIFYSHNVKNNVKFATCIHKVNRSEITYITDDGLEIKRTIYIRRQHKENEPIALERQVVEIKNLLNNERHIDIVFTGMFGSANPGCQMEDVIYQSVINQTNVIYKDEKMVAIAPDYYPNYAKEYVRFALISGGFDAFSYDVNNFLGNGSILFPEHLLNLGNRLALKGPSFYALKKSLILNDKVTVVESIGLIDNKHDLPSSIETIYACDYKKELNEIISSFKQFASYYQIKSSDNLLQSYVNNNLPFQILYQTYVSRAFAQTQKGYREMGFREIQDLYASMEYLLHNKQNKLVKSLLGKWISNVYKFGYVNHNFFFVGKEPGMCSDDGLWLVDAIKRYIDITNDYDFLNTRFPIAGMNKKRSLYDTLKAIITYSGQISIGEHHLPLLDKADWNDCLKIDDDCLDGPTKEKLYQKQLKKSKKPYGSRFISDLSESVMNAFLLKIGLDDMIQFAKHLQDNEYEKEMISIRDNLVKSIQDNAYIDGYFARVLINRKDSKYKYVGTPHDKLSLLDDFDGSLYLNSFSWSILSGVASESQIKEMLFLVDKYLKTKAGYKLCTPHDLKLCGSKTAATEQYFLGDRENGGVFKHATMMFVVACLKASKTVKDSSLKQQLIKDADYMLDIVLPFNVLKDPYKYKGNPRFCTQYVNSISEEHIGPILSGTAPWLFMALKERDN